MLMKTRPSISAVHVIMAGLILCLAVAVISYVWATALMGSLFAYRSPLKDTPPEAGAMLGKPATQKVVFILVDALRLDTSLLPDVMPTLNRLRQQGASATMHSRAPSYSEPGYSTLLIGAWPGVHDGPVANLEYEEIPTWTQDNVFSAASRAGLKTAVSGYYWFEKLIPQTAVNASFYTPGEDQQADREVVNAALPWLSQDFGLILIHIDQVDYAGHHEGGPRSPNWAAAARRADDMIAEILSKLDLSKDTILVCSDHGQIDSGGHGGPEPVVLTEPFVLAGAGIKPGSYADIQMVDVAPTVAALLGINLPASTQGQARQEMLNLPAETLASLPGKESAQQALLLKTYSQAINRPISPEKMPDASSSVSTYQKAFEGVIADRLYTERVPRALTVGFILLLLVGVISRLNRRALAWSFAGAALAVGIFHLRYALIDGHPYSLSWVTGQMDLMLYVAITSAIGLLVGWLLVMLGRNAFRHGRSAAAQVTLGYLLAVFGMLSILIGIHYVINGAVISWAMPEIYTTFLALLSLIQALITAALGLLLVGLAALLARKPV